MTYTWGDTNRWYAQARKSGDPSELAFVAYLRGKITARRNRRASHAPHSSFNDVPSGAHTGSHGADFRLGAGIAIPHTEIRAHTDAQAPDTDHLCDPEHGARQYHLASDFLRHFGDLMNPELYARLEAIKEYHERRQPTDLVSETVKQSLRRW